MNPLGELLTQVRTAASLDLHLVALGMAVALPDICAALIDPEGRTGPKQFKEWCSNNLNGKEFSFVTPDDIYSMRCGVLHQGRYGDLKHNVARVIFTPPSGVTFTNCKINDAYIYSVSEFCNNICDCAENWYKLNEESPIIKSNIKRMMQYYKNGLPPYIEGLTVIA
jgi:hypothetical protein